MEKGLLYVQVKCKKVDLVQKRCEGGGKDSWEVEQLNQVMLEVSLLSSTFTQIKLEICPRSY